MPKPKKDLILEGIAITGIAEKGRGVGRDNLGRVMFIDGVVPGDTVDVRITEKKKGFLIGEVMDYQRRSADRVPPPCAHFGICGGCQWQHLDYAAQIRYKETQVRDALQRIGKVEIGEFLPILGCEETYYYRNKLEFAFSNKRWLTQEEMADKSVSAREDVIGFHRPGAWDKIVPIRHCHLQGGPSNDLRNGIRDIAAGLGLDFWDVRELSGYLRNMVVRTTTLGESMILLSVGKDDPALLHPLLDRILERFPQLTTLVYCINTKPNDVLFDLDMQIWYGPGYVIEKLGPVRFKIGPKSFFQTNSRQAERLYEVVAEFAGLTGTENVFDLYTGVGSIALFLADRCRQVVGIEEVPEAIADARENAALNGLENAVFYAGDVKNILSPEFALQHGRPDLVVTDPPRAGMHPEAVRLLRDLQAPRMVYVSCNPATQARDLNMLSDLYEVERVQPVDMFPHTGHVENVALLRWRG